MPGVDSQSQYVRSWFLNADLQRFKANSHNPGETTIVWNVLKVQTADVYDRLLALQLNNGFLHGKGIYLDEHPNAPRGYTQITIDNISPEIMAEYRRRDIRMGFPRVS